MRIVVLHNAPAEEATVSELDVIVQRDAVLAALRRLGHDVSALACTLNLADVKQRLEPPPDVVFNLVESLGGTDRMMPAATLLLDSLGIPYTGAGTAGMLATTNKLAAKQAMLEAGLPTAPWFTAEKGRWCGMAADTFHCGAAVPAASHKDSSSSRRDACTTMPAAADEVCGAAVSAACGAVVPAASRGESNSSRRDACTTMHPPASFPQAIIKAVWEHASFQMIDDAVLASGEELMDRRLTEILERRERASRRPFFAELYIDGREFNVTLLAGDTGPVVLPPAEIDFSAYAGDKPRIVCHKAKWDDGSFEFHHTPRRFEFPPDDAPLLDELKQLSCRCWELFAMRGYARVDFRVDRAGRPWILEVNANPCLAPNAGFAAAVERSEMSYDEALDQIVRDACR